MDEAMQSNEETAINSWRQGADPDAMARLEKLI